jgi:transcriptional regulator with XRE-family HTH domain
MADPADFGVRLRRQRERRGVSLQHIAHDTKINSSLLADLERGDLSRWPAGIFGRAFVRSYAEAIGLEPREVLTEFVRLVPANEGLPPPSSGPHEEPLLPGWSFKGSQTGFRPAAPDGGAIRLTFAEPEASVRLRVPRWGRRFAASAADGAMLLAGAAIGLLIIGPGGWLPGLAVVAVALVVLASTVLGTTPGRRLFNPPTHLRAARRPGRDRGRPRPPLVDRRDSSEPAASERQRFLS